MSSVVKHVVSEKFGSIEMSPRTLNNVPWVEGMPLLTGEPLDKAMIGRIEACKDKRGSGTAEDPKVSMYSDFGLHRD